MSDENVVTPEKEYEAAKVLFEKDEYQKQLYQMVNRLLNDKPKFIGRVLRKLVLEPFDQLNNNEIPILHKEEKELYDLCKQVMYAKSVVFKKKLIDIKNEGEENDKKEMA
jgi:DNA replication initiation complex subunit (GINS family)